MQRLFIMIAIAAGACERQPEQATVPSSPAPAEILQSNGPVSKPPAVVSRPKHQAEVDRLILAGYTPHADHLHSPGVNECPLTKGSEAVM